MDGITIKPGGFKIDSRQLQSTIQIGVLHTQVSQSEQIGIHGQHQRQSRQNQNRAIIKGPSFHGIDTEPGTNAYDQHIDKEQRDKPGKSAESKAHGL